MILCGDTYMWLAVMGLVVLAGIFVLCTIGYCLLAYRWCERQQEIPPNGGR